MRRDPRRLNFWFSISCTRLTLHVLPPTDNVLCMQADQTAALVLGEELSDSDSDLECGQELLEELGDDALSGGNGEVVFVDSGAFTEHDLNKWAMADGLAKLQDIIASFDVWEARLGVACWRANMNQHNAQTRQAMQQTSLRHM